MGYFYIYHNTQLRASPSLEHDFMPRVYNIGDTVDISDGVYLSYGSWGDIFPCLVVIKDNKLLCTLDHLYEHDGGELDIEKILLEWINFKKQEK